MKKIFLIALVLSSSLQLFAQGNHDFKIKEVYIAPDNATDGYENESGKVCSWIEIENISYTTHDLKGCFLTIEDPAVLDALKVADRMKKMYLIPSGDPNTVLNGQERAVFFADGKTNYGTFHTDFDFKTQSGKEIVLRLYDGNGIDILDDIVIPAKLKEGCSYAKVQKKVSKNGEEQWIEECRWMESENITPKVKNPAFDEEGNVIQKGNTNKIQEWKAKDPHGIAMAIISMSIVFGCLLLLFVFFHVFGWFVNKINRASEYKAVKALREQANKVVVIAKEGIETKGIEMDNYVAAISLALHEYFGNNHDVESGIITIVHHPTEWESKDHNLRHVPEVHIQQHQQHQ